MVMACGVGAFTAGMFHLYTHAFFKACLFLGAGSVLHALAGEEDMRRMGGLARRLPFTFGVFLLATLALCGLPPFAGFFSKDEILWSAYASTNGSVALWLVGSATSFLTAFYMFRAVFMTFCGASRVDAHAARHLHEPPATMSVVLALLAAGSIAAGWIGLPQPLRELLGVSAPFHTFLGPVLAEAGLRAGVPHSTEVLLMVVAVVVALAGIALAWLLHGRPHARPVAAKVTQPLQQLVTHGYYFDALYDRFVVRGLGWLSTSVLARGVEAPLTSASLVQPAHAGARATRWFSQLQTGDLQAYVIYALLGLALVLGLGAMS
jgi:NADH-quinone oxidoreductase subunit L